MKVTALISDAAPSAAVPAHDPSAFEKVLSRAGSIFASANEAEDRFATGAGNLQQAIYERARADVALAVATAAAQRSAQALQSVLSMQV